MCLAPRPRARLEKAEMRRSRFRAGSATHFEVSHGMPVASSPSEGLLQAGFVFHQRIGNAALHGRQQPEPTLLIAAGCATSINEGARVRGRSARRGDGGERRHDGLSALLTFAWRTAMDIAGGLITRHTLLDRRARAVRPRPLPSCRHRSSEYQGGGICRGRDAGSVMTHEIADQRAFGSRQTGRRCRCADRRIVDLRDQDLESLA